MGLYVQNYFSCLPAWDKNSLKDVAFICYVCIAGGIIPATVIVMSNLLVFNALQKVSYIIIWNQKGVCYANEQSANKPKVLIAFYYRKVNQQTLFICNCGHNTKEKKVC